MISISYSELSRTIHQHYAGRRVLLEAAIEVTHRCPLQCVQCYNNLAADDRTVRQQELSLTEHYRLLDELADLGCLWVLFTGGEIFLRPDFLEIYTYAKKKGFLVTLFTNAILIDERVADYLAEWPPFAIEVTVYGRTKATYESVTTVPGSYERCMRAIELLRERKLPVKLKTVAVTLNGDEVSALRRFAEESLQVEFKFDPLVNPRIDGSQAPLAARLSPEQVVGLEMRSPKLAAEFRALYARDCGQPVEDGTWGYGVQLRRRHHLVRNRSLWTDRHLRDGAAGDLRFPEDQLEGWLGQLPATGASKETHPQTRCVVLSFAVRLRHVSGMGDSGERRCRVAG